MIFNLFKNNPCVVKFPIFDVKSCWKDLALRRQIAWLSAREKSPDVNSKLDLLISNKFKYLGSFFFLEDWKCDCQSQTCIRIIKDPFQKLDHVLKHRKLSVGTMKRVTKCDVLWILLYELNFQYLQKNIRCSSNVVRLKSAENCTNRSAKPNKNVLMKRQKYIYTQN